MNNLEQEAQQNKPETTQYLQTGINSQKNVPFVKKQGVTIVGSSEIKGYQNPFPNRAARRAANKKK